VSPTKIDGIVGVSKAYITRVGAGPFPSEELGPLGDAIRKAGNEFGSVTGRPRRCGWFDVPLLRYTAMVNGFDSLIVTKLDVLDELPEIPVCVSYKCGTKVVEEMPAANRDLEYIKPVYETVRGWKQSTRGVSRYEDTNFNDVSSRDFQFADGQWQRGKSCDTFAPMGPFVATIDENTDPHHLGIRFRLNGETLQDSNTDQLIFGIPELVEFLSRSITLEPGDVVATGTPPGVGFARKPPIFMKEGDVAEVAIDGLGVLSNPVVSNVRTE
jgi:hypothetical protein